MLEEKVSYTGPSMNPTLKVSDLLEVIPYHTQSEIKIGDVVVFKSPAKDINVVHRVVSVSAEGIWTRGDNNSKIDQAPVKFESIIGKVISARKGKRPRIIWGGLQGQIYCALVRINRLITRLLLKMGHQPYRFLARTSLLGKIIPLHKETKIVIFKNSKQLILGKRVIGYFLPRKRSWRIYPPYRLFIDEAKLPC